MKMLVHAGLCEGGVGGAPEAAPAVPPTSHRPGLPSPWQVVTSGSLQAWSRCAAERWTGMRLWENTSPSSSRSVPARSTSPVPVQDRCTVIPGHWCRVSRQRRLTSAGTGQCTGMVLSGCLPCQLRTLEEGQDSHPPFREASVLFLGVSWVFGVLA